MRRNSTRRGRTWVWSISSLCLGLGWIGLQLAFDSDERPDLAVNRPLLADEPEPTESTENSTEDTVRLNFFNATWPTVLRKLAKETHSELVMKRAPAGRFTRIDRQKFSRTDAVRLLNREMEPKGFRLLEQGDFLVVLHLDSLRTRYARPTAPATNSESTETPTPPASAESFQTSSIKPVNVTDTVAGSRPISTSPFRSELDEGKRPVSDVSRSTPKVPRPKLSPVVVPTRKRGAKDVAMVIYTALKDRSELIHNGPGNLPAFQVFQKADEQSASLTANEAVQFAVGIDTQREELVVSGTRDQQRHVAQMIRTIDAAATGSGSAIRLVASEKDVRKIAQRLRPAVKMMLAQSSRALSLQQPPPDSRPQTGRDNEKFGPPSGNSSSQPQGSNPNGGQGDEPLVRIDGIRGPVEIQEVPGVGMVVTGNQNDVDAVVRLMRQLEQLAAGAVPSVELLRLRHVNSEALAELLSTVYEELTTIRGAGQRSQAAIIPVGKPNSILVIAAPADLESIAQLAERLDEPVDPRTEFQVFPLKNAVASQVVETINTLYSQQQQQQQQQEGLGLRVRLQAVADARTNSVIVQAAPRDLAEVALLIRKIDRDNAASINRMRVFPLKNAVADELAEVINTSIQSVLNPARTTGTQGGGQFGGAGGAGQSAQQLRDAKSVVLEFLTADGDARRIIRSGILADIRVTADPRVNSLIITAPETSMPLMAELIRQLDQPTSNVAEIKVFTLTNSDAAGMAQLLETLFTSEDTQNQLGVQVAGAEDASSGLIPLRFSVDIRTNSIIAIGGAEALRVVEAILLRLDETDIRQRKTVVIKLKNSPAQSVADAINQFLQSQRDLAQIDPELVSNVELLEREIIVEPELVSNSLLVSATPRYYEEVLDIIEKLDEAPAQVVIQVLIVEVLLDNTDEFGVELGFQDSLLFDRGLLNNETFQTITNTTTSPNGTQTTTEQVINAEGLPGFLFNNAQLGNNTSVRPGSVGQQALSNFSLGRVNGDLGFGGLVLSASSESVSVLVRALASQRNVHILSRPQIRTVDNQLAQIQVGQQVPVITGATTNALGGITPSLGTPQQVGIILQVTPRITPDGVIVMETIANKSAFAGQGVPIITDPTTGAVVESPIFDLTEARSTIAVPDGQTVVLGGMITKSDDTLERKVPWLGDIPLIGTAFRYDGTQSRRTELIIFMTPRIIRNAADSELIKQVEAERLHFLEDVVEEVHGPIYAVPGESPYGAFPESMQLPPGEFVVPPETDDESDVPTTIMPGDVPPPPEPKASFKPIPPGLPISSREVGRQRVRLGNHETIRGNQPRRKPWYRRLPFFRK